MEFLGKDLCLPEWLQNRLASPYIPVQWKVVSAAWFPCVTGSVQGPKQPQAVVGHHWSVQHYNLLAESTRGTSTVGHLCSWLAKIFQVQDIWNECRHSRCLSKIPDSVKVLLFQHIQERLHKANPKVSPYSMEKITTSWGQEAVRRKQDKFEGIKLVEFFDHQFQEDILIWHIDTTIFLAHSELLWVETAAVPEQVKFREGAKALSEYLMFLLAVL